MRACPGKDLEAISKSFAIQQPELRLVGHSAQNWKYLLADVGCKSFEGYLPRSVSGLDHVMLHKFMMQINREMDDFWRAPEGALGTASRHTAWVVAGNCRCKFRYGGDVVQPSPWPNCMDLLMAEIMPRCGLGGVENKAAWPNSCNLSLYPNGSANVS